MSTALFSSQGTGHHRHILSFKAGRCFRDPNGSKWVHPEGRKGLFFVDKQDDGLLHIGWKDRETHEVVDDFIVFAEDAVFEKVSQSPGRVYALRFTSSGDVHFFWMQYADQSKDSRRVNDVNALIADPDALDSRDIRIHQDMGGAEQLMNLLSGNMDPSILSRLSQEEMQTDDDEEEGDEESDGDNPHEPLLSSSPTRSRDDQQQAMDHLQSMIRDVEHRGEEGLSEALSLENILTVDMVRPMLSDPQTRQALFPYLPEGTSSTEQEIVEVISSAPFKRSLRSLSTMLNSGQLGFLASNLGLGPEAGSSVRAFLQGISDRARRSGGNQGDSSSRNNQMDTD